MKKLLIILTIIAVCFTSYIIGYNSTTTTTNLSLVKPASEDETVDWFNTMNDNMDLIDAIFDTVTLTEYGYLDGVTSAIQTQLDAKTPKTQEEIEDYAGAMFTGNTETGLTITYQDGDGTIDAVIGANDIVQSMLKCVNEPNDEEIFTYESTTGDFEWHTLAELSIQPLDTALTNISALTYVSPSFIKLTADDTYAVRTIAETKTDLAVGVATSITDNLILKADFADEDWGDMTVSTNVVTIDNGAVTYAKIQNVTATDKILGRVTAGAGTVEEIACTAAGRAILDDADASAQRTTLGLVIGTDVEVDLSNEAGLYAVLSDVALFLEDTVDDTTPELGGELDAGAHSIGFTQQSTTGDGTTTIDWKLGNKFKFTFGAQNDTFTFTAPSNPCNILLMLIQDGTGSRTATWPGTVKWANGTAPTLSTAAATIDICSFYYDGTNYFGVANFAFAVP